MTVNATTPVASSTASTSSTSSAAASAATQGLSYNDFLTLLMAELQNQDPTQPMDPAQMVSQLATVSEVGQAVQTNTTLASLLTATSLSQAEQLVGQTITSADGSTSGQVASVSVTSTGSADGTVRTWDAVSGNPLRTLKSASAQILSVAISPDGRRIAAAGSGDIDIVIADAAANDTAAQTTGR